MKKQLHAVQGVEQVEVTAQEKSPIRSVSEISEIVDFGQVCVERCSFAGLKQQNLALSTRDEKKALSSDQAQGTLCPSSLSLSLSLVPSLTPSRIFDCYHQFLTNFTKLEAMLNPRPGRRLRRGSLRIQPTRYFESDILYAGTAARQERE